MLFAWNATHYINNIDTLEVRTVQTTTRACPMRLVKVFSIASKVKSGSYRLTFAASTVFICLVNRHDMAVAALMVVALRKAADAVVQVALCC